ncbi:MAG: hypothetical protein HYX86_05170 [Chloroflexi bacterium]|nr:hypothetical protein [Chloroflexota bacterium]
MEINLGDEQIIVLESPFTPQQIQEKAQAKKVDAFGQVAKFVQRPKAEDIEITTTQGRFEPFWYAVANARYVYDRRHAYRVEVAPEVKRVTLYDKEHPVSAASFSLEGVEHCEEETRQELLLDALSGRDVAFTKYLSFPKRQVAEIAALQADGAVVVLPEVRGSFVVRKLVNSLMKTFHADKIYEEKIDVQEITLFYRQVSAVEYYWKAKEKKQVLEFDGLTGEVKAEAGEIKKKVVQVLENDDLFDIGADAVGTIVPGASIAVKLGRLAARKLVK